VRTLVAIAILLLALLLAALVVYILARRLGNTLLLSYRQARRAVLEPAVDGWLAGDETRPPACIEHPRRIIDRTLIVDLVLDRLPGADSRGRDRMHAWLRRQGLVARWIRDLAARSSWRRGVAAERLAVVRDPESVPALVRVLDDPSFDVRMRAAKALGALGGIQARRALVGALGDENRWSVIRIADLLAVMGPEVVDELVAAFPGFERASRLAALDLVARLGDARLTPFLAGLLDDLDRDVRARAASALGRVGDERAAAGLTAALQDNEWPVRAMSAKALGLLGATGAAGALAASLRDREWWVRANAAEALTRLRGTGIELLVSMLDDQDRFARDQALGALENCGELSRRLASLGSPEDPAHAPAQRLLEVLAARQPRSHLEALRDRQGDPAVRAAIDTSLRHVRPGKETPQ